MYGHRKYVRISKSSLGHSLPLESKTADNARKIMLLFRDPFGLEIILTLLIFEFLYNVI